MPDAIGVQLAKLAAQFREEVLRDAPERWRTAEALGSVLRAAPFGDLDAAVLKRERDEWRALFHRLVAAHAEVRPYDVTAIRALCEAEVQRHHVHHDPDACYSCGRQNFAEELLETVLAPVGSACGGRG